jgi:hypothetical protein
MISMTNTPETTSELSLIAADTSAFLRSVRSEITNLLTTSDEGLRKKLADVYAAATVLSLDKDQWQSFCEQEEWRTFRGKPKPVESCQANALKYAVRYAVGFDGVSANQAAYRYSKALEGCWAKKLPPADVPDFIKEGGGVEKLKQSNQKVEKGLTVVFDKNSHAKAIAESDLDLDAILLVRFEKGGTEKRAGRIILGAASKDGAPSIQLFTRRFERWQAKNRKSRAGR